MTMQLASDFSELIAAFDAHAVEYLVVGGYAVGAHGRPRATKDLDLCRPQDLADVSALERLRARRSSKPRG